MRRRYKWIGGLRTLAKEMEMKKQCCMCCGPLHLPENRYYAISLVSIEQAKRIFWNPNEATHPITERNKWMKVFKLR